MNDNALIIFAIAITIILTVTFVIIFPFTVEEQEVREFPEINETIPIDARCGGTVNDRNNCLLIIENQYKIIKLLKEKNIDKPTNLFSDGWKLLPINQSLSKLCDDNGESRTIGDYPYMKTVYKCRELEK